jgi:enoyl-[acyl-carrier protein] reductase II
VVDSQEGDTLLTLKELTPVRLLRNPFFDELMAAYQNGASAEALAALLGRGRAKKGMFEGDLHAGELEIGQIAGNIETVLPAGAIVQEFITDFNAALTAQSTFLL